jgi:hypothetical protein
MLRPLREATTQGAVSIAKSSAPRRDGDFGRLNGWWGRFDGMPGTSLWPSGTLRQADFPFPIRLSLK